MEITFPSDWSQCVMGSQSGTYHTRVMLFLSGDLFFPNLWANETTLWMEARRLSFCLLLSRWAASMASMVSLNSAMVFEVEYYRLSPPS